MSEPKNGDGPSGEKREARVVREIEPFDPTPSIELTARTLRSSGTPFALIGGLALDAWGIPRATKDADFAVPYGSAEQAADCMASETTKKYPLSIGGVAIRDATRNLRIDLIDRRFHLAKFFRDAISEAEQAGRMARIRDTEVPLVSLEHLLAMKIVSGEPKDDTDARRILQLEALDYRKARGLVEEHLGFATANRLDAFAREVGRPDVSRKLYKNGDEPE